MKGQTRRGVGKAEPKNGRVRSGPGGISRLF